MGRLDVVIGTEIIKTETDEIRLGHTFYEVEVLKRFIEEEKPDWFVEIGIHEGGLSYLLIPTFQEVNYLGVELSPEIIRPEVIKLYLRHNQSMHIGDCFSPFLFERIEKYNRKIIYCDGGNKAKELKLFKEACRSDDIILTHDFYDGRRKVRGVPDENISKEVLVSDIQHMEDDKTFERLDEDIFKETRIVGWRKL